ncbi:MAG: cytidine deaminase [Bacillota bacterium]
MDKELMQSAINNLKNTHAVYSNFKVSAALRLKDGTIINGVNVENASYGLSNCAERSALFAAYSQGYRKDDIVEMALTTEQDKIITPCGACRQVMSELVPADVPIVMADKNGDIQTVKNLELLPFAFTENDL